MSSISISRTARPGSSLASVQPLLKNVDAVENGYFEFRRVSENHALHGTAIDAQLLESFLSCGASANVIGAALGEAIIGRSRRNIRACATQSTPKRRFFNGCRAGRRRGKPI